MQAVILCGGFGTRLASITRTVPKSMIEIEGKVFLEYQLELLKKYEIRDIVLCVGHLKNEIIDFFGDGSQCGVNIIYSEERYPLGTAGAVKNANKYLQDNFILLDGDAYVPINYTEIVNEFGIVDSLGLMVIFKNNNLYDNSNVIVNGGLITAYERSGRFLGMVYIHSGITILRKSVLDLIPDDQFYQLDLLFSDLIKSKQLCAFETAQRFYEIGSLTGLNEFKALVKSGGLPK